jgi:pyruvate dehydrogenase E2 component (dihydrolipoamide acetyltransferase)
MAITHEIRVPNIGDFKNVPIVELLVKVGDVVRVEDPLVAIESEKATMEVPSPFAGTVGRIDVKLGDNVSEGSVLLELTTEGEAAAVAPIVAAEKPAVAATPAQATTPPLAPAPAAVAPPETHEVSASNGVVHASPSIRRFARELGVDLHRVGGSGPHARVTRDDVQNFVKVALSASPASPASPAATSASPSGTPYGVPAWPVVDFAKYGAIETVALSRIRKFSGPNLHRNWLAIPHVTNNDEADITELEAFRKAINKERADAKVTMLAFVMKAVVVALRAHPEVNSSLVGDSLVLKKYYNIGFAADTPQGLVVPVLAGADTKGVLEIATETAALAAKARDGKLAMAEMTGATFTISSLGGIGGTSFTPIVNAPEVAILGVSRSAMKPVWDGSTFVPRLMLPLSLSYDHRVIDGALAARFNVTLASALADLRRALL